MATNVMSVVIAEYNGKKEVNLSPAHSPYFTLFILVNKTLAIAFSSNSKYLISDG